MSTCDKAAPIRPCVLTAGHPGIHWPGENELAVRKKNGETPLAGTLEDVHELQRVVRKLMVELWNDGVRLR